MKIIYATVGIIVFLVFSVLYSYVYRKIKGGYIDFKANAFLMSYTLVFLLKAIIFCLKVGSKNNMILFKFIVAFCISLTADLTTFLAFTFIFDLRDVNMKLSA